MLEQLKLTNLALSTQAEVDFTPGMICITGETGAGKSLVVDALALVLGAKADANMVRQGQKQLEVEAIFSVNSIPKVKELLQGYGFADEDDDADDSFEATVTSVATAFPAATSASSASSVSSELSTLDNAADHDDPKDHESHEVADGSAGTEAPTEERSNTTNDATADAVDAVADVSVAVPAVEVGSGSISEPASTETSDSANSSDSSGCSDSDDVVDSTLAMSVEEHAESSSPSPSLSSSPSPSSSLSAEQSSSANTSDNSDNDAALAAALQCAVVADGHAVGYASAPLSASVSRKEGSRDLLLRRVVSSEGKSKAYINGHLATLTQLREIAECLVAIHGQHASVRLMDEKTQLETVDNFGKLRPLVYAVNDAFNQYSSLRSELMDLSQKQKAEAAVFKQDRYDLEELKKLHLQEGDYEELEAMFDRAMHQEQFSYALANLRNVIEGGDTNILSLLREQMLELDKVKAFDPNISKIMENLEAVTMHLDEATNLATDLTSQEFEMSAGELERKMSKVHELARRFSCLPRELYLMTERLERKVNDFWSLRDRIENLTSKVQEVRQRYEDLAKHLSEERVRVAADLVRRINEKIKALALPDARFDIHLERDEDGRPKLGGRDRLTFMFSANLGQDLKPLAAVASGGELSRLALTLEVLTASVKSTPTLIFDEVDTGISGRTASAVGTLLQELGQYVQVITVTHLPQVAAKANTQFVVAKYNEQGQVNSTITPLDQEGRIEEISRMIGGSVITDTTRKSALELLSES